MPSTVYKGDIAEVSFATETSLTIKHTDATIKVQSHTGNTTVLRLSGGTTNDIQKANTLRFPVNILVGSQVVFETAGSLDNGDAANQGNGGKTFTIIANDGTDITITPVMVTTTTTQFASGDVMHILPYKTPPIDRASEKTIANTAALESCKIDQFLGVASAITLPETKVDLKRYHVVGLGRDTSIQVPGKMITEGGSFEVNMHTARWLKYCLGNELIYSTETSSLTTTLDGKTAVGASRIKLTSAAAISPSATEHFYVEIKDTTTASIVSDHEENATSWNGAFNGDFDRAETHECRRVLGKIGNDILLDEPLKYAHADNVDVIIREVGQSNTKVTAISNTGQITFPVKHLLFSKSILPSFCLEVSQRRIDVDSDNSRPDLEGAPGDSKELTRVYRGCKVTDFSMTTDNDAALRLSVNFNSALCYTDTGRLEGTPLTRYAAHRMFDDTANTEPNRIVSGIGKGTQKPFMFYNGNIKLAGQNVAQVFSFTLNGTTGMVGHHTINSTSQADAGVITDQVPFNGSRNVSLMVEGQTTYDLTMEIAVDDPIFYHKMRTGQEFSTTASGSAANQILLEFEKNLVGGTSAANSEKMVIIIDDYYIIEAPIQIPEDKGIVKSTLKVMPKAIKVVARDTIPKY
tara:strand:+ start:18466 stop:20370 length:1905 start_codon:yes stop_codon:yes gene_type:complete